MLLALALIVGFAACETVLPTNRTFPVEFPSVRMILVENGAYASFITDGTMADFYARILNSTYLDWLSAEYSYNNRTIHRGVFNGTYRVRISSTEFNGDKIRSAMVTAVQDLISSGLMPESDTNTIFMYHIPDQIKCGAFSGSNSGQASFVLDCDWMRLPLAQTQFWIGVGALVMFLILLCCWPVFACTTEDGIGKCRCGSNLSAKTLFHCFFIVCIVALFFTGGFIMATGYVNNRESQFVTGMIILYTSGGVLVLWLVSLMAIMLSSRLAELRCCFNLKPQQRSLRVFNAVYLAVLLACALCAGLLIGLSLGSNVQITASHELFEIITGLGTGSSNTIPLANAPGQVGIGNYCQIFEWDTLAGRNGVTLNVQRVWSNINQRCVGLLNK